MPMDFLRQLSSPTAVVTLVICDGQLVIVLSGPVELGDVGQIKAGDDIPADAFGLVPSSAKADQVGL